MKYIRFNCSHAVAGRIQSGYNIINMSFPREFIIYFQSKKFNFIGCSNIYIFNFDLYVWVIIAFIWEMNEICFIQIQCN